VRRGEVGFKPNGSFKRFHRLAIGADAVVSAPFQLLTFFIESTCFFAASSLHVPLYQVPADSACIALKKALSVRQSKGSEPVSYEAVDWKNIKRLVMNFNRARTMEDKRRIVNQIVTYVPQ
jgi:hypothetical protein